MSCDREAKGTKEFINSMGCPGCKLGFSYLFSRIIAKGLNGQWSVIPDQEEEGYIWKTHSFVRKGFLDKVKF